MLSTVQPIEKLALNYLIYLEKYKKFKQTKMYIAELKICAKKSKDKSSSENAESAFRLITESI